MQEWVSIYETNESDIETPDIHRLTGCQQDPRDRGVTGSFYSSLLISSIKIVCVIIEIIFNKTAY